MCLLENDIHALRVDICRFTAQHMVPVPNRCLLMVAVGFAGQV